MHEGAASEILCSLRDAIPWGDASVHQMPKGPQEPWKVVSEMEPDKVLFRGQVSGLHTTTSAVIQTDYDLTAAQRCLV